MKFNAIFVPSFVSFLTSVVLLIMVLMKAKNGYLLESIKIQKT